MPPWPCWPWLVKGGDVARQPSPREVSLKMAGHKVFGVVDDTPIGSTEQSTTWESTVHVVEAAADVNRCYSGLRQDKGGTTGQHVHLSGAATWLTDRISSMIKMDPLSIAAQQYKGGLYLANLPMLGP